MSNVEAMSIIAPTKSPVSYEDFLMSTIKKVLLPTQGVTGGMLLGGLHHALQDRPEERHELQVHLLKMTKQVLSKAQASAQIETDQICQGKVDAARAGLQARNAALSTASELLAAAEESVKTQKNKLAECQSQLTSDQEEHSKAAAADNAKANDVAVHELGRNEVARLLEAMTEKGSGDAVAAYLRSVNAEPTLVAGLRSVLEKEPSERCGFDVVALEHLRIILEQKVAEWDALIRNLTSAMGDVHAEALGCWAIKELAGENVSEAIIGLEAAEAALLIAQQRQTEAIEAQRHDEAALVHCLTDLTLAGERLCECRLALQALQRLEAGPGIVEEVAPAINAAMVLDGEMVADKTGAMMDVEMGVPITA